MRKVFNLFWILVFIIGSIIPLCHMNMAKITKQENRTLAKFPELKKKDKLNADFGKEFENWLGDHFGGRKELVNARLSLYQKYFKCFPENAKRLLGLDGEEYYFTSKIQKDYLHLNLLYEKELKDIANSLQKINNYIGKDKIFFYYQCWDKQSIYPEHMPSFFVQKEKISRTDQMVESIKKYSDIFVISPKSELMEEKKIYRTYPQKGDTSHWSQRGAYIGYLKLMNTINKKSKVKFNVLKEKDFSTFSEQQGKKIFLNTINARNTPEKLKVYSEDRRSLFYTNNTVDNKIRILIIGDSYFIPVFQMLTESFYETILIWGDHLHDVKTVLDSYAADIIIIETAERVDRTERIIKGAKNLY